MTSQLTRVWIIVLCAGGAGCGQRPVPPKAATSAPATTPSRATAPVPVIEPAPARALPSRSRSTPKAKAAAPVAAAEAAPGGGILHIDSDVAGAQVFIDRQYVGVTPMTAPNVPPGVHQLNISAPGFNGIAQSVDVEPGPRDLLFRFKEVRLDAVIDVIHKHRLGSCKGKLIATPQGIRYETTDKSDAFSAPLAGLERFDVDYLAKTLHVKLAKGKAYDFTDPDGNADRLFVFHRDADAARKKLAEAR